MSKTFTVLQARQQNYTSLRAAFRSENGAIDLASIMVGIIVIGLIGGVIAATVFAVIPWAQDNAAKQQLDSIHTAENASYGLSADPTVTTDQTKRNKFTNSAGLQTAALLSTNVNYCVIPTADGQNFNAYAKSASGKVWTSTNSKKTPAVLIAGVTCLGTVADGILAPNSPTSETGTGDGSAVTPSPVAQLISSYNFEDGTIQTWEGDQNGVTLTNVAAVGSGHGTRSLQVSGALASTEVYGKVALTGLQAGSTYRVSIWVYQIEGTQIALTVQGVNAPTSSWVTSKNVWQEMTFDFVAVSQTPSYVRLTGIKPADLPSTYLVDDVKVEKLP